MNSDHFEHSPDPQHPAIELDKVNFVEQVSEEHICGKVDVRDDGVRINQNEIDWKTEDRKDLAQISSISVSGLEQGEMVRKFNTDCFTFVMKQSYVYLLLNQYQILLF